MYTDAALLLDLSYLQCISKISGIRATAVDSPVGPGIFLRGCCDFMGVANTCEHTHVFLSHLSVNSRGVAGSAISHLPLDREGNTQIGIKQ